VTGVHRSGRRVEKKNIYKQTLKKRETKSRDNSKCEDGPTNGITSARGGTKEGRSKLGKYREQTIERGVWWAVDSMREGILIASEEKAGIRKGPYRAIPRLKKKWEVVGKAIRIRERCGRKSVLSSTERRKVERERPATEGQTFAQFETEGGVNGRYKLLRPSEITQECLCETTLNWGEGYI